MGSDTSIVMGLGAELKPLSNARITLIAVQDKEWRLKGVCDFPDGLTLTELLGKLGVEGGPELSLSVTRLGLEYANSGTYGYFLTSSFGAKRNLNNLVIRAFKEKDSFSFGGELNLGGLLFAVRFGRSLVSGAETSGAPGEKTSSTSLVATVAVPKDSKSVSLRSMLSSLTSDTAWAPDLPIALRQGLFAYQSEKDSAGQEKTRFLLGLKLDMGASFKLSSLPLIGQELKGPGSEMDLRDLELLVASSSFDAAAAAPLNELLPPEASPLPAGPIEAGLRLTAKLTVGGSELALPPLLLGGTPTAEQEKNSASTGATPQKQSPAAVVPSAAAAENAPAKDAYQLGPLSLKKVQLAFDSKRSSIVLRLTGGVRFSSFQFTLIDAGVSVPLDNPSNFKVFLGGVAVSVKAGAVSVTGAFMDLGKGGTKYGGLVRVDLVAFSVAAIGLYEEIELAGGRKATSLFIYGALNLLGGSGIPIGPLKITGLALAFGLNRRLKLPPIEKVADFPLVKMALAESAADLDPRQALEQLGDNLPAEVGQSFGCLGVRFTIAATVDCFALGSVQFGNDLELSLLGLARYKRENVCFLELALKVLLRPSEGVFLAQAQLTGESWVLDKKCRVTGGFAIAFWFGGPRKGDFVISLGGYHPRFKRPEHYPNVPRLGFNWQVTDSLSMKGELYFAIIPSALMAGGRLEAAFRQKSISASFEAYFDLLMEWAPLHYTVDAGISIKVRVETFLATFDFKVSVALSLWGPPFGGRATINVSVVEFSIDFGASEQPPLPIDTWAKFAAQFVDKGTQNAVSTSGNRGWTLPANVQSAPGPSLFQFTLNRGELLRSPRAGQRPSMQVTSPRPGGSNGSWYVRGDELELSAATLVPVTCLMVGQIEPQSAKSLPGQEKSGDHLLVREPVSLKEQARSLKQGTEVGIRPMAVRSLTSILRVTVVQEDKGKSGLDLSEWSFEEERTGMPGALWDTSATAYDPEVKVVQGCIAGLTRLRPPPGRYLGPEVPIANALPPIDRAPLDTPRPLAAPGIGLGTGASASAPAAERTQRQEETARALQTLGFKVSPST